MYDIAFIIKSPYNERDKKRFGIEVFEKYKKIIILDCTPFIYPKVKYIPNDSVNSKNCIKIYNHSDLYKNIKLCNNNGFVIDIADIIEQKINSLIKSKNIKIIKIGVNAIPYFIKNDKNKLLNKVIKNIASKKIFLLLLKKSTKK